MHPQARSARGHTNKERRPTSFARILLFSCCSSSNAQEIDRKSKKPSHPYSSRRVCPSQAGSSKCAVIPLQQEHSDKRCVSNPFLFLGTSAAQTVDNQDEHTSVTRRQSKLMPLLEAGKEPSQKQHTGNSKGSREIKSELVDKRRMVKKEMKKIQLLKKGMKVNKEIKVAKKQTRQQIIDSSIQNHNKMIQLLKREIELLKEKQRCKMMKYGQLRSKGYKGVLSETLWQCKATKIRFQYLTLDKMIQKISNEIHSRECKLEKLISDSSCNNDQETNSTRAMSRNCDEANNNEPPLYSGTPEYPLHHLLPKKLYSIEEETEEDMRDYDNGVQCASPRSKSRDYCSEYNLPDGHLGWMDFLNLDAITD